MRALALALCLGVAAALPTHHSTNSLYGEPDGEISISTLQELLGEEFDTATLFGDPTTTSSSSSSSSQTHTAHTTNTKSTSYFVSNGEDDIVQITVAQAGDYGLECLSAGTLTESAKVIVEETIPESEETGSEVVVVAEENDEDAAAAAAVAGGEEDDDAESGAAVSSAATGGAASSAAASEGGVSSSAAAGGASASSAAAAGGEGGSAASSAASSGAASSSAAGGGAASSSAASGSGDESEELGAAASSAAAGGAVSSAAAGGASASSAAAGSKESAASSAAAGAASASAAAAGGSASSSSASGGDDETDELGSAASSAAAGGAASSSAAAGGAASSSAASGEGNESGELGAAATSAVSGGAASSSAAVGGAASSSAAAGGAASSSAASGGAASSSAAAGGNGVSEELGSAAASAAGKAASSSAASGGAASSSAAASRSDDEGEDLGSAAASAASAGAAASSAASSSAASSSAASQGAASSSAAGGDGAASSSAAAGAAASSAAASKSASSSSASASGAASSSASASGAAAASATSDGHASDEDDDEEHDDDDESGDITGGDSYGGDGDHDSEKLQECICVPYYLCREGDVVTDGEGLIDIRFNSGSHEGEEFKSNSECPNFLDVCCRAPLEKPDPDMTEDLTEYDYVPSCGHRNPSGIHVSLDGFQEGESQFGEFPWMAIVLEEEELDYGNVIQRYVCGGSLVHPRVVMTAAHCVHRKTAAKLQVRLGDWDTKHEKELFAYEEHRVSQMLVHEKFNRKTLFYDVALLYLAEPVELKQHIDTLCLPEPNEDFDLVGCVATGFGKDKFHGGSFQNIMKQVDLNVVPHKTCQKQMRTTKLGRWFRLHKSFTCAVGEEGADTCTGDGGSPLACPSKNNPDKYVQTGIVAWGIGCGEEGLPGAYASVPKLMSWVNEKMAELTRGRTVLYSAPPI